MIKIPIPLLLSLLLLSPPPTHAQTTTQTAFSPSKEAVTLVENTIYTAHSSIEIAAYRFTSYKIADALIAAHHRGVKVRVLLDKSHGRRHRHRHTRQDKALLAMQRAGIPIRINHHYAIMHDKYMIIDNNTIETGSFNYTASAERRNAENVLVIRNNPTLARQYKANWEKLWNEGE